MKIKNLLNLALAGGILMTGCNKEEGVAISESKDLTYASIVLENGTYTKADTGKTDPGTEEEKTISKLEFYVFDENGQRDYDPDPAAEYKGYSSFTGEDVKGSTKLILMSAGKRQVLVVANMDLGAQEGKNKDEIEDLLTGVSLPGTNPTVVSAKGIPMVGESEVVTVAVEKITDNVAVPMKRLFARLDAPTVDLNITVEIENDEDLEEIGLDPTANITFELNGFVIVNGLNESYIQSPAKLNGWVLGVGMAYHNSSYKTDGSINSVYSGTSFLPSGSVYVYENNPATIIDNNGAKTKDPKSVYAMLVEGTLSDGTDEAIRYWRVNLSKDQVYAIYRNAQFKTEILKITSIGYGTPKDAEEDDNKPIPEPDQTGIIAHISIVDWEIFSEQQIL